MKTFSQFLFERVQLRARKDMPQIDDMDEFINDITKKGYRITSDEVSPKSLKPTQHEFNMEKVNGMIKDGNYRNKPIVTTKDGYILDGHHRWKACMEEDVLQPIVKVNMNFDELYDFVDGKKYVKYKEIHESKLHELNFDSNMSMSDYMTDDEKNDVVKNKVKSIYDNFFTVESFNEIRKSIKEEGGAAFGLGGGGDGGDSNQTSSTDDSDFQSIKNKPNSTTNVSMPSTMIDPIHRRRHNIDDDADITSDGAD